MLSNRVLLGLPDNRTKTKDKLIDPFAIRLGGLPIGLDSFTKPPVKFSKCKNCSKIMPLILQTRACIDHTNYDRVIYIWACCNKYCQYKEGSVRVIRGILYIKKKDFEINHFQNNNLHISYFPNLGDSLFNTSSIPLYHTSNPFQINSSAEIKQHFSLSLNLTDLSNTKNSQTDFPLTQNSSQFKTEIKKKDEWPNDNKIMQYPPEFLYIIEENERNYKESTEKLNLKDIEEKFVKEGENEWYEETYEKSTLEKGFNIFTKKIISNPQQCVRYQYNRKGQPLYYSFSDSLAKKIKFSKSMNPLGKCRLCNSQNVFELQVMPNTINILEKDTSLGDMLWGTIIIGTCGNDCIPDLNNKGIGYAEEWAGVQWEDMKK
ncbi:hypothetical protein PMAC_003136 [Pneumocystis sp. 'macacae']|nr:hypothetical protein PMAC_003136 [Pneumocystis sp. 'macacae']